MKASNPGNLKNDIEYILDHNRQREDPFPNRWAPRIRCSLIWSPFPNIWAPVTCLGPKNLQKLIRNIERISKYLLITI